MTTEWADRPEEDKPNSWLVLVHVWPIPEEDEARAAFGRIADTVQAELPAYEVEVSAVYASKVEVVGMDDLDNFDTIEDLDWST